MTNRIINGLEKSLDETLEKLENSGDIVITTSNKASVISSLVFSVRFAYEEIYGKAGFSQTELEAISRLIFEAIEDEIFFDQEKVAITGFTKEEFEKLKYKIHNFG